jgi:tetratricopeptide (TPR) repeat protein
MENSPAPERAEGAADRLAELNIQIGHMIHMPSHIYARVGRWHDASVANEQAIEADRAYLEAYEVEGMVPLLYHPHNIHFLAWTAGMEGRSNLAIDAADELVAATPAEMAADLPFLKNYLIMPSVAQMRFEHWDDVLATPEPDQDSPFLRGMWHYARGLALAAGSDLDEARAEAARLTDIAASDEAQALELPEAFLPGATMLGIADATLQGEIMLREGQPDEAVERLRRAVELQDTLPYMEPPYWSNSARLDLGRALLEADRPAEAEEVYRADLEHYPRNGWALHGLAQSLQAQGEDEAAEEVAARFEDAWQHADMADSPRAARNSSRAETKRVLTALRRLRSRACSRDRGGRARGANPTTPSQENEMATLTRRNLITASAASAAAAALAKAFAPGSARGRLRGHSRAGAVLPHQARISRYHDRQRRHARVSGRLHGAGGPGGRTGRLSGEPPPADRRHDTPGERDGDRPEREAGPHRCR